ncbi:MAG: hypothetical protein JRJ83_15870 [Deltaproteobacteria bacterium]|nr:hypothetical protein [Deltaproteobacteria bacterium]
MGELSVLTAYLDTCIVSGLAKEDLDPAQLVALLKILEERKHGRVLLVTSPVAKEEIDRIPEEYRTKHEVIYNLLSDVPLARPFQIYSRGLMGMGMGMHTGAGIKRLHPMLGKLTTLLPDEDDARHLYQAARNGVQYFLTADAHTILSYRERIGDICNVKAVTPMEFLEVLVGIDGTGA